MKRTKFNKQALSTMISTYISTTLIVYFTDLHLNSSNVALKFR